MRRAPQRIAPGPALALVAFGLLAATALADITFGPTAQEMFGITADGTPVDGERTSTYQRGYDKFRMTDEGQRIFEELDASDVEITIEIQPEVQVSDGDAWGTARPSDLDITLTGFEVRAIEIEIADDQFDSSRLANTIHHELRHGENFMDGNFHGHGNHRALDDGDDPLNKLFRAQVGSIDAQAGLERAREDAERRTQEPVVIGPEDTPNYTRIMQEAGQAESLSNLARRLGYALPHPDDINDYLDSIKAREATLTGDEFDIQFTSVVKLEYSPFGVDLRYNKSVFECGTFENGRRIVCPTDVQDMPAGEVITLGMIMVGEIPQANPDRHYIYAAVFDSDVDPANNWQFHAAVRLGSVPGHRPLVSAHLECGSGGPGASRSRSSTPAAGARRRPPACGR